MANKIPKSLSMAHKMLKNKEIKVSSLLESCYSKIESKAHLNAFITVRNKEQVE